MRSAERAFGKKVGQRQAVILSPHSAPPATDDPRCIGVAGPASIIIEWGRRSLFEICQSNLGG